WADLSPRVRTGELWVSSVARHVHQSGDCERVERERDLYARLLELGTRTELGTFLRESLALVVEITGADQGYLELSDDQVAGAETSWSIAHGFTSEQVERIQGTVSSGIIASAIATGQTIETASALLDPRFQDRESVQVNRI